MLRNYSVKMYKNQFRIWGFEKNLTKTRLKTIMSTGNAKDSIQRVFTTARIQKYFKRRKAADNEHEETPNNDQATTAPPHELDGKTVSELAAVEARPPSSLRIPPTPSSDAVCQLAVRKNAGFRIDVIDL